MPIYEYTCDSCRAPFEELRRISDRSRPACPACGGRKVRRLMSRSSFQLKGGGWYKDLYASPKPSSDGTKTGATAGESKSKGEAA